MPAAPYLTPAEYQAYGVGDATLAHIESACRVVNTYMGRPEGLVWSPDATGAPAYMDGLQPSLTLTMPAAISPGQNVSVTFPGQVFGQHHVGEVVVIDRADVNKCEACVVLDVTGGTLTLAAVRYSHAASAIAEFGLTLLEESPLAPNRSTVRLSRSPIARLLSGYGRYAPARRSQRFAGQDLNATLLGFTANFGGPPSWVPFPVAQADINTQTGEVWIPPGLLMAYFSDARLRYVCGWPKTSVPADIKQAVATVVRAAIDSPFGGNLKLMKAGDATVERFSASALDADTKALLQPYMAVGMR